MPYLKPLPEITPLTRPFWDGTKNHEFLVPKCKDCGAWNWTPYEACRQCLSTNLEWTKISGQGELYTFSLVYSGMPAFMEAGVPWVVGVAQMSDSSGPRPIVVMATLINCKPEDVKIGMPVKIAYEDIPDEDITMYRIEPA